MLLPVIPRSLQDLQRWRGRFAEEVGRLSANPPSLTDPARQVAATSFYLSYHGLPNRDLHVSVAELYRRACPSLSWTAPHCHHPSRRSGRARIGFVSRYLYDHSIGKITRGILAALSRERFESVALFVPPVRDDAVAAFIRAQAGRALVLPRDLQAARETIAALELDVLFYQDIGMEPFTYFLAHSRLAPVQCVSFGHPDTTGIPSIDYFISNDLFEPDDAQAHYSEKLFLLRDLGTLSYYYRPAAPAAMKSREAFGFAASTRLYLCPQTLFKLHPSFDETLGEILRADADSRLVLLEGRARHWSRLLRARFARSIPDVAERIVFLPPQSPSDFTSLIAACDVMLDTPHFNGMTTSLEAFALGKPVVTMRGALQRCRHTAGMYRKMDFQECVAGTSEDYVRLALRLGTEADFRSHAAGEIARCSAVLFEDRRAASEFERFFTTAIAATC